MPRHDPLTYDVEQRRTGAANGVNRRLLVLLIGIVVLAALLVFWTIRSDGSSLNAAGPSGARSPVAGPLKSAGSSTPQRASRSPMPTSPAPRSPDPASAAPAGSDAAASRRPPAGSETAAQHFIAAWLERDPKLRRSALQQTAVPGLAEELMLTATANIPNAQPAGAPVLEDASAYSVQFVQRLSSGMRVRVYLVADPQALHGWMATSVEQA